MLSQQLPAQLAGFFAGITGENKVMLSKAAMGPN